MRLWFPNPHIFTHKSSFLAFNATTNHIKCPESRNIRGLLTKTSEKAPEEPMAIAKISTIVGQKKPRQWQGQNTEQKQVGRDYSNDLEKTKLSPCLTLQSTD
ncbi:hypothetical protein IQ218_17645 [Synechocystis salina LEGE 06099]|nr:hypothetical protein [Synechocystis salina LEGE 06099]